MGLTENKIIDKIEVIENGIVQVREATRIFKDGGQIAQTYHRWILTPGQDVSDQEPKVQAICNAAWTPEVILAYQKQQEENAKKLGA